MCFYPPSQMFRKCHCKVHATLKEIEKKRNRRHDTSDRHTAVSARLEPIVCLARCIYALSVTLYNYYVFLSKLNTYIHTGLFYRAIDLYAGTYYE